LFVNEERRKIPNRCHLKVLSRVRQPVDMAQPIVWLLRQENSWVTGQTCGVDGSLSTVLPRQAATHSGKFSEGHLWPNYYGGMNMRTLDPALWYVAAGLSLLLSVYLWFLVDKELGLFVGIWVPSILSLGTLIQINRRR